MLRALLVGLLSVSAVACKSGGDSPKSQPGVAAGKVVEVTGTVTVRHDGVAQPLVKGATLEGDDVIETGADGNAVIELSHNLARWELGPNKSSKVRESAAWSLAKKTGDTTVVNENTAAAGRPAERSAADTSVSAAAESARAEPAPAAAAPPAPEPAAAPPPPPPSPVQQAPREKRAQKDTGGVMDVPSGGGGAAPKGAKLSRGATGGATADSEGGAPGGGATVGASASLEKAGMSPADADKAATDVVLANMKSLEACLTKDAQAISVSIKIAATGKATAVVSGKAAVPAGVQSCVKSAVAKMKFAAAATTVKVEVAK
jgi:hypothetical protein